MRKMKQGLAVALTATMVLGSAFTVLAEDTPTTSGSTSGAGTSEGHVDKEVLNMVLPTVAAGTSPFAYTMDPERLIQETEGAKYDDFTFPAKDSDTGVYFLTGDKTYANTSNTLQAINKSSCDVTLTVKVKAEASVGNKDIALATSATPSTAEDDPAELYLGLKVGNSSTIVKTDEQTVTKTVAGTSSNFATTVKDKEGSKVYVYEEKADATTWKAINISMTGAVSAKAITADTTAPTVNVTWSYAKAATGATVDTEDQTDYTTTPPDAAPSIPVKTYTMTQGQDVKVNVELGTGSLAAKAISGITYKNTSGAEVTLASSNYDFADGVLTIKSSYINDLFAYSVSSREYTVTFNDTAGTKQTITLANK